MQPEYRETATASRMAAGLHVLSARPARPGPGKPPLLFVHGAWHGAWCWEQHFLPFFAGQGYEVHALDLRGHGQSPAKKPMRWNRIADYVDDVRAVVGTFDKPPVVIGHSMGGLICQHLMRRTDHLAGVGLLATVPSYGVWRAAANIALHRPLDFARANLTLSLYPLVADPVKARHMFIDEEASAAETRAFAARLTDESYLGFLDMLAFALPRAGPAAMPMLIVGGGKDTLFSPSSQRHTANRYGCDCHIVPGAPHDLMLSRNWQVAAGHFLDWLARF